MRSFNKCFSFDEECKRDMFHDISTKLDFFIYINYILVEYMFNIQNIGVCGVGCPKDSKKKKKKLKKFVLVPKCLYFQFGELCFDFWFSSFRTSGSKMQKTSIFIL